MKKEPCEMNDDLQPEYDLKSLRVLRNGGRVKAFGGYVVALEPDVAAVFGSVELVNEALRFSSKSPETTRPNRAAPRSGLTRPINSPARLRFRVCAQATRLRGSPCWKARRLSVTARRRRSRAARVAHAIWGVIRQLGACKRGLSAGGGSVSSTSSAAPASLPCVSASASAGAAPLIRPGSCSAGTPTGA